MRHFFVVVGALALVLVAFASQAITIVPTYDTSITSLGNAAQVEAAFATAAHAFENHYTNVATINITVYFSSSVGLGESQTAYIGNPTYAQLTNALHNARVSSADSNSVASLPASSPIASTNVWWIPRAEAKALYAYGLNYVATNDATQDGAVYFASTVSYTFDATNRAVSGKYDFIGVAEHEISEVLGRGYALGTLSSGYQPCDLFRFTSAGVRNLVVTNTPVYFSTDNGVTVLQNYYTNAALGDVQDWLSTTTPDAYDAFLAAGQAAWISPVDITALDVLGYNTPGIATKEKITPLRLTNGNVQLTFSNLYSVRFTILASTNVTLATTNWTTLGVATEIAPGEYQYVDTQTAANKQRFYRVRSP